VKNLKKKKEEGGKQIKVRRNQRKEGFLKGGLRAEERGVPCSKKRQQGGFS